MTHSLTLALLCGATSIACAQAKDTSHAGHGAAAAASVTATATPTQSPKWLTFDAATNTVTFQLVAGATGTSAGPFNFNGHTNGDGALIVPPNAKVILNFVNDDGTPHSAEVISGTGPIPNLAGDPAIPTAYTRDVSQGIPQFGKDVMRFTVPDKGDFRIFCGVPGHGLSGMWIWFKVDPSAKTPSFGPTKQ